MIRPQVQGPDEQTTFRRDGGVFLLIQVGNLASGRMLEVRVEVEALTEKCGRSSANFPRRVISDLLRIIWNMHARKFWFVERRT